MQSAASIKEPESDGPENFDPETDGPETDGPGSVMIPVCSTHISFLSPDYRLCVVVVNCLVFINYALIVLHTWHGSARHQSFCINILWHLRPF